MQVLIERNTKIKICKWCYRTYAHKETDSEISVSLDTDYMKIASGAQVDVRPALNRQSKNLTSGF